MSGTALWPRRVCAAVLGISPKTWDQRQKRDPCAPSAVGVQRGARVWSSVDVMAYRRQHEGSQKRVFGYGAGDGDGSHRYMSPHSLQRPVAYAVSYAEEMLWDLYRLSSKRYALFRITNDGVPRDTLIRLDGDIVSVIDELKGMQGDRLPEDIEVRAYETGHNI